MITIPGWLIALLTFPGVILHEWAHKFFCDRARVPVFEVKYFSLTAEVAGYVKHEEPSTFWQSFSISCGPLFINSLATSILGAAAAQAINGSPLQILFVWLGLSFGMHAFPSDHDAKHVAWAAGKARGAGGSLLYLLAIPFVWLIHIANALRFFWLDLSYAGILFLFGLALGGWTPPG